MMTSISDNITHKTQYQTQTSFLKKLVVDLRKNENIVLDRGDLQKKFPKIDSFLKELAKDGSYITIPNTDASDNNTGQKITVTSADKLNQLLDSLKLTPETTEKLVDYRQSDFTFRPIQEWHQTEVRPENAGDSATYKAPQHIFKGMLNFIGAGAAHFAEITKATVRAIGAGARNVGNFIGNMMSFPFSHLGTKNMTFHRNLRDVLHDENLVKEAIEGRKAVTDLVNTAFGNVISQEGAEQQSEAANTPASPSAGGAGGSEIQPAPVRPQLQPETESTPPRALTINGAPIAPETASAMMGVLQNRLTEEQRAGLSDEDMRALAQALIDRFEAKAKAPKPDDLIGATPIQEQFRNISWNTIGELTTKIVAILKPGATVAGTEDTTPPASTPAAPGGTPAQQQSGAGGASPSGEAAGASPSGAPAPASPSGEAAGASPSGASPSGEAAGASPSGAPAPASPSGEAAGASPSGEAAGASPSGAPAQQGEGEGAPAQQGEGASAQQGEGASASTPPAQQQGETGGAGGAENTNKAEEVIENLGEDSANFSANFATFVTGLSNDNNDNNDNNETKKEKLNALIKNDKIINILKNKTTGVNENDISLLFQQFRQAEIEFTSEQAVKWLQVHQKTAFGAESRIFAPLIKAIEGGKLIGEHLLLNKHQSFTLDEAKKTQYIGALTKAYNESTKKGLPAGFSKGVYIPVRKNNTSGTTSDALVLVGEKGGKTEIRLYDTHHSGNNKAEHKYYTLKVGKNQTVNDVISAIVNHNYPENNDANREDYFPEELTKDFGESPYKKEVEAQAPNTCASSCLLDALADVRGDLTKTDFMKQPAYNRKKFLAKLAVKQETRGGNRLQQLFNKIKGRKNTASAPS